MDKCQLSRYSWLLDVFCSQLSSLLCSIHNKESIVASS